MIKLFDRSSKTQSTIRADLSKLSLDSLWLDPNVPYVLFLMTERDGKYFIVDPQEDRKIWYSSINRQDCILWLVEDEYHRVDIDEVLEINGLKEL